MKKTYSMKWELGLHARPSLVIVKEMKNYNLKEVIIIYRGMTVPLNSGIIDVLLLGIGPGQEFELNVKGPDEKKAFEFLDRIFSSEKEVGCE